MLVDRWFVILEDSSDALCWEVSWRERRVCLSLLIAASWEVDSIECQVSTFA